MRKISRQSLDHYAEYNLRISIFQIHVRTWSRLPIKHTWFLTRVHTMETHYHPQIPIRSVTLSLRLIVGRQCTCTTSRLGFRHWKQERWKSMLDNESKTVVSYLICFRKLFTAFNSFIGLMWRRNKRHDVRESIRTWFRGSDNGNSMHSQAQKIWCGCVLNRKCA